MIISKIFQGLGNQFFQYAFGYARARDLDDTFKIDSCYFDSYSEVTQFGYTYKRDFGLNRFNISATEASPEEIDSVLFPRGKTISEKLENRRRLFSKKKYKKFQVKEEVLEFDPTFFKLKRNTYIDGYFTDERYFRMYRNELISEFTLKSAPSETNQRLLDEIKSGNSVCISIRRTNFLNNPLHGTCGEDYYYEAMKLMATKINNPIFYVFSDDNEWVNNYFDNQGLSCVYVQHNFPDFYEDFRLMQHCKHHIIPNSTFPWWAAWLSNDKDKIVIAPNYWLNTDEIDYSGYLPQDWIKLEHVKHTFFKGDL